VLNRVVVDPEHGTIDSPLHPDQVQVMPGAAEALRSLHDAGWALAIVSNQPAAAKGKTTLENLKAVNARVVAELERGGARIAGSYLCLHRAEDGCDCRKPRPGLLKQALEANPDCAAASSWMVGDGVTDVQAGRRAGVRTAYLGPRKCDACAVFEDLETTPEWWGGDLAGFAAHLRGEKTDMETFTESYLQETAELIRKIDARAVEAVARGLAEVRERRGRLFILGVGGSAGHASHAVNDFRKICGFESYTPTDNVSELTARINDDGWESCFEGWLKGSRLGQDDAVLVFSVGGGNREKNVSMNLVRALEHAMTVGAKVYGIVGKDGGYTAQAASACILVPVVSQERITPHTEGFCAVLWHLLVSHPALKVHQTKWESTK